MVNWRWLLRMSNRSLLAFIFFFSMSTTCLYFIYVAPGIANTYYFMVQAQGIMLRDNVRTISQMIRLYTNKNSTLNGTVQGKRQTDELWLQDELWCCHHAAEKWIC